MGSSKGSSTTTVQMTPEQRELLQTQTNALKNVFIPAYANTISGAGQAYQQTAPAATTAAQNAMNVAGQSGNLQQATGTSNLLTGSTGLQALFDPQYEQNQIQAALQAGRESGRELVNQQNAAYGAAGSLGSSRAALAGENLASLQEQRQATAAAEAQAKVQANKAAAAQALMGGGQTQLGAANQLAAANIGYAQTPQDIYNKYAQVIFGVPQGSTTPNFSGTQGQTNTGTSKGFSL